jgi:hypothetical protein
MEEKPTAPSVQQHRSQIEEEKPPNGGLTAWLQVLGGYFIFFNSWYVENMDCVKIQ